MMMTEKTTHRSAIIWNHNNENNINNHHQRSTSNSYWEHVQNGGILSHLVEEEKNTNNNDDTTRYSISYPSLISLTLGILPLLKEKICQVMDNCHDKSTTNKHHHYYQQDEDDDGTFLLGIPVAVAIPEGVFLPICILAVHLLNRPFRPGGYYYSIILVPLEPTEGRERLGRILEQARPALVLTATDCDYQRLQEIILSSNNNNTSQDDDDRAVAIEGESNSSQFLYRCPQTQVVDFVEIVRQAAKDIDKESILAVQHVLQKMEEDSETTTLTTDNTTTLQQWIYHCERQLSRTSTTGLDGDGNDNAKVVVVDDDDGTTFPKNNNKNRISHIVFTSGTTGSPKGCISSLQSLQNYIRAKNHAHQVTSDNSVVLLASALSFDPCLSDILATFTTQKASLALVPRHVLQERLFTVLQSSSLNITHVLCTPTLWSNMMFFQNKETTPNDCSPPLALQVVALGGEPISNQIRHAWARSSSCCEKTTTIGSPSSILRTTPRLCATFGVTEACVYQTLGEICLPDDDDNHNNNRNLVGQNVGKPFAGMGVLICVEAEQTKLVDVKTTEQGGYPDGVGEVVLFGDQLDKYSSYLNQQPPELAFKFVYDKETALYYYRTGDRGYIDPASNNLYILGRIKGEDGMVKFNGIRVELGEIEGAIVDNNNNNNMGGGCLVVVDCIVTAISSDTSNVSSSVDKLIVYCVFHPSFLNEIGMTVTLPQSGALCTPGPLLTLLRERCRQASKVVPTAFVAIPRIPLSPTGKRFRSGVPSLQEAAPLSTLLRANEDGPSQSIPVKQYGEAGVILAETIIDCLNLQPSQEVLLTTTATFGMLGGDSLAATRVVRTLYAYHHNVNNSRFLGGEYGVLDGPFGVVHLLNAPSLGSYVDWLDDNHVCGRQTQSSLTDGGKDANGRPPPMDPPTAAQDSNEAEHLYHALMQATTSGHSQLAMALLKVGADPNHGAHGGRLGKTSGRGQQKKVFRSSPLHLACFKGLPRLAKALIKHKAKYNTPDASGLFPIHLAAASDYSHSLQENEQDRKREEDEDLRRLECVKILLHAGAPLAMKTGSKQTILHVAARSGHSHVLRHVLQLWVKEFKDSKETLKSLDWRDQWQRTAVHWAVLNGKVEALRVLLEMGCSADPPKPKANNRSSAAIETPMEMCIRVYYDGSSSSSSSHTKTGIEIKSLLQNACGNGINNSVV